MSRGRGNGEGSIYPVKDGYRGYIWCTNPAGERYRKYVKAKTYEDTRTAWLKLRDAANRDLSPQMCQAWQISFPTGWKRSYGPISHPRHARNTSCFLACTSFPT